MNSAFYVLIIFLVTIECILCGMVNIHLVCIVAIDE